jgi:hypothetical protein
MACSVTRVEAKGLGAGIHCLLVATEDFEYYAAVAVPAGFMRL